MNRTTATILLALVSIAVLSPFASAQLPPAVQAPAPRIAMLWSSIRNDRSLEAMAKHDLILASPGTFGLKWNAPPAQATGFTPASIEVAKLKLAQLRKLNPRPVILSELYFYEWQDSWLPEDHAWWLRKEGKRVQFWPGTHRLDWYNAEVRGHVVRWAVALREAGLDGVFFDNLREEPEPWVALLRSIRERTPEKFLILANAGYAVGKHDFAAPYLNGVMYESGWSHGRTEWDSTIQKLRHTESLLREPRISVIERFEDVGSRAGWPGDAKRGQKPTPDPAARRWSLCFSLIVADTYYLFSDNTSHQHDWYPEYDSKLGRPAGEGERLSAHVWRRRYERGLVLVNLPGAERVHRVELEAAAANAFTGVTGNSFDVPPGEGAILLHHP